MGLEKEKCGEKKRSESEKDTEGGYVEGTKQVPPTHKRTTAIIKRSTVSTFACCIILHIECTILLFMLVVTVFDWYLEETA